MRKNRISYFGKVVYIGIDVHKKTYSVTCRCEGEEVKRATLEAIPEKLVSFLEGFFSGASLRSAYEAGYFGFELHRYLVF